MMREQLESIVLPFSRKIKQPLLLSTLFCNAHQQLFTVKNAKEYDPFGVGHRIVCIHKVVTPEVKEEVHLINNHNDEPFTDNTISKGESSS